MLIYSFIQFQFSSHASPKIYSFCEAFYKNVRPPCPRYNLFLSPVQSLQTHLQNDDFAQNSYNPIIDKVLLSLLALIGLRLHFLPLLLLFLKSLELSLLLLLSFFQFLLFLLSLLFQPLLQSQPFFGIHARDSIPFGFSIFFFHFR